MKYQARSIKGKLYDKKRNKLLADVVTVTYPDLELLSDTFRGAGINGELDLPTYGQFGSLVVEIAHNGLSEDIVKTFRQEHRQYEHRWASQVLNSSTGASEIVGKKVIFEGYPKKLGIGSIEPNKAEESSTAVEVTYIKYSIGNDVVFELDKLNDKFVVGGVDYSAALNAVL